MSKNKITKLHEVSCVKKDNTPSLSPALIRVESAVKWAVAISVMSYVVYRIFALDLTSDEWGSMKAIYCKSLADLIVFKYVSAQSHFLQSVFSTLFFKSFPEAYEVAAIRLPTLIGLLCYLYAAYRITAMIKTRFLSVLGFVAICTNAFLLDYFGLARGYGMALGFQLLSLCHLINVFCSPPEGSMKSMHLAIWFACFAVLSNLAWMYFYGAVCAMLLLHIYGSEPGGRLQSRLLRTLTAGQSVIYNALLVGVFYLPRVILLTEHNELYFGGVNGFVEDTVKSLVRGAMYIRIEQERGYYLFLAYGVAFFCGVTAVIALTRWWWGRIEEGCHLVKASGVISAVLLMSVAIIEGMHYFFNVKFIIERAATGLLAVGICHLVMFGVSVKRLWRVVMVGLLILIVMVGMANLNLNRWSLPGCSQLREFVRWIGDARAQNSGRHLIIGTDSGCNWPMWYYIENILGLTESEETKASIGFVRIYNGVTLYSVNLPENKSLFDDNTDFLLLNHRDTPGKYPRPLRLVKQYHNAQLDLFACEGERSLKRDASSRFKGVIYPVTF